jgi:hypothetical protein
MRVIGLCGLIGSGKGTVAEHLMEEHNYVGVSFAETLKDAAACIFGWDRDMLEGDTERSRAERELKDEWWSERMGFDVSPRYMLQFMGTEVMRNNLHQNIWALATEKRIIQMAQDYPYLNYVISDVRFPNEFDMIHRLNGEVWHIQRGELPDWFGKNPSHIHASETAWNNCFFDATIQNNGTIEDLKRAVDNQFSS